RKFRVGMRIANRDSQFALYVGFCFLILLVDPSFAGSKFVPKSAYHPFNLRIMSTTDSSSVSSTSKAESTLASTTVTYNWPVDVVFLRSCIYECSSDYGQPTVIDSPKFEGGFYPSLYPKDPTICHPLSEEKCPKGSLFLRLDPQSDAIEDSLNLQVNVSIMGGSEPVDQKFEGILSF